MYKRTKVFAENISFHNHVVTASFRELVKAFGPPEMGDDYKVSAEWTFAGPEGSVVTLYDYKATALYDSDLPTVTAFRKSKRKYNWHVGAETLEQARDAQLWLTKQLP